MANGRQILWVDDEVQLLEPHLLFLQQRGYEVDTATNGDDALELLEGTSYDLILLDEQMPGRSGLDLLRLLRRDEPHLKVVMVTKSEEDHTMQEAIGRRVDDYLVKPASPRQVLSVITRLLEGSQLRQQRAAQDFAGRFVELSADKDRAESWKDYFRIFSELVDWDLRLEEAGEEGLLDSVRSLRTDLRREFGVHIKREYGRWLRTDSDQRPPLSTDIIRRWLVPGLDDRPVMFVIIDCMRLDQWRLLRPLLTESFDMEEELYASILPTATPYSRNAIFSGKFPDDVARERPGWWEQEEGSLNAFEDELFRDQLVRLVGREVPVHYEKIFSDEGADDLAARVRHALRSPGVVSLVFNFVDLLTHGRSESSLLMEVAPDVSGLRALTRQWFERSAALRILRDAAAEGVRVILTSDHGSILCQRPVTVYARRDATSNLRYKFGQDLRAEQPQAVLAVNDESELRFPTGRLSTNYLVALEDYFFVYPTKLREYQARYRGSFLHGGASPEEMILPIVTMTPR